MAKVGRPRRWNPKQVEQIKKKLEKYIKSTDIPIITEFAYMNGVVSQRLYEYVEFSTLLKMCTEKKQANLEKGALSGQLNTGMAIFSLKQLGWSDKQDVNLNADVNHRVIKPKKPKKK